MRTALAAPLALAASLAVAACSDPTIDVTIVYQPTDDPGDPPEAVGDLPENVSTIVLSVIVLDGVSCDQVKYGEISADVLAGARRTTINARDGRISGVPRLGDKLIVLDGFGAGGRRVAGGCTPVGDIDGDTAITIAAAIAPRLHLVPNGAGRDPGAPPESVLVIAREPWGSIDDDGSGIAAVPLRVRQRDSVTDNQPLADIVTGPEGGAVIVGPAMPPAPGPVELEVRAPWSTDVLRIPAFQPVPLQAATIGDLSSLRDPNRIAPSWAISESENDPFRAAAVSLRTDGVHRLTLFTWDDGTNPPRARSPIAAGLHSVAVWPHARTVVPGADGDDLFVTRVGGQWQYVDWTAGALVAIPNVGPEPLLGTADELITVSGCKQSTAVGMLARTGAGAYVAYASPGVRSTGPIDAIARAINQMPGSAEVIGLACLPTPTGLEAAVVARAVSDRRTQLAVVSANRDVRVPAISGVGSFGDDNQFRLIGGEFEVDGPRAVSYKVGYGADRAGVAIEVDAIDHRLAAPPTSFVVHDLDGDQQPDTIAAIAAGDTARIQVTYTREIDGRPLTGVSSVILGQGPRVLVRKRGGAPYLVVTTSEMIGVLDLGAP